MKMKLTLIISHPTLGEIRRQTDRLEGNSKTTILKCLNLQNKYVCELKNHGTTEWTDDHGSLHLLTLEPEAK